MTTLFATLLALVGLVPPVVGMAFPDMSFPYSIYGLGLTAGCVLILGFLHRQALVRKKALDGELEQLRSRCQREEREKKELLVERDSGKQALEKSHDRLSEVMFEKEQLKKSLEQAEARSQRLTQELLEKEQRSDDNEAALTLLGLLQREGRFLDFVTRDVSELDDETLGRGARFLHQGCARVLSEYFELAEVTGEEPGSEIDLSSDLTDLGFEITGATTTDKGALAHRGWLTKRVTLPKKPPIHLQNSLLIAPAIVRSTEA